MGAIAEKYSDFVVITSDNPRNEDMRTIISDILTGISDRDRVQIDTDRKHAIQRAISEFRKNSERKILLVAGKGHETYQEISGQFHHFNDKEVILSS